jgi:AraC-like DNA-binding protein
MMLAIDEVEGTAVEDEVTEIEAAAQVEETTPSKTALLNPQSSISRRSITQATGSSQSRRSDPLTMPRVAEPLLVKGGLAPWQARNAVIHVETHLNELIRIEDLAALARLSVSHFNRAFKASFGETPYGYILSKRIELACQMMNNSDQALSQIALACGFADQAHLCNHFKRLMNCTPTEWRRYNSYLNSTGVSGSYRTH